MSKRRRLAAIAAVVLATGLAVPAAKAAAPSPSPGSSLSEAEHQRRQLAMHPTLDKIRKIKDGKLGPADPAWAGDAWDAEANTLTVFRVKGSRSPSSDARYTNLSTPDLTVVVKDAVISANDCDAIAAAINVDVENNRLREEGIIYVGTDIIDADTDHPGKLEILIDNLTPAIAETMLTRYADKLVDRSQITVREAEEADGIELAYGRQDDNPPWYGGARVYTGGTGTTKGSTNGFSIAWNPTGSEWVLVARHALKSLSTEGKRIYRPPINGAWYAIGYANSFKNQYDSAIIGANTDNHVYDGAWNGQIDKVVSGQESMSKGMSICLSGSYSGIRCGIEVQTSSATNENICDLDNQCYNAKKRLVWRPDHLSLGGDGDSGSPLWENQNDGTVHAVGTFEGGRSNALYSAPCTGVTDYPQGSGTSRNCYWTGYVTELAEWLNADDFRAYNF